MRNKTDGKFITIEGGEGCGKSTLIKKLKNVYPNAVFVNDPSKDIESTVIMRDLLLSGKYDLERQSELLLYVAARCEMTKKQIVPALEAGKVVISDRYDLSTYAYQGEMGRGFSSKDINYLSGLIDTIDPDLFIVLSLDPKIGIPRSKRRLDDAQIDEGMFENLDMEFHNNVYKYMAGVGTVNKSGRVIRMELDTSEDDVLQEAVKLIDNFLEGR